MAESGTAEWPTFSGLSTVIFVTVGSSTPFDRLIAAVDDWAGLRSRTDVVAQIGNSQYKPKYIQVVSSLEPSEFRTRVETAKFVVAHAGMGSIITALEVGKPIVILPRREHLNETRNDHQLASANQFSSRPGIIVALDETQLAEKLDLADVAVADAEKLSTHASASLIDAIRSFISNVK